MDLSRAFYTLDHAIPLHTLEQLFGTLGIALEWLKLYLQNNRHIVYYNGVQIQLR